ncbi:Protein moonraker [Bagarius yarrelli]|uniref:Protein moonraker n=1 Tax=Bagarius yarrelli TaxID=175774 RepID=A0A556U6V3_BAGYA|nr:Protein moonraker [Bagarius yarrelli]
MRGGKKGAGGRQSSNASRRTSYPVDPWINQANSTTKIWVKVAMGIAYFLCVSIAAFILAIYYVFFWTPDASNSTNETAVSSDEEATAGAMQMVDRKHDTLLQDPMLDNMLLRMEEIEKDEEEVRRRFATISYSDPLLWDMGIQRQHTRSRPASPQPIRLTKPAKRHPTTGDIVLQTPVETGLGSESFMLDEEPPVAVTCCLPTEEAPKKGTIRLNVPSSIQKTIYQYRKEYDSYLRLVSHAAVGSFNPCDVAESLAEELIAEALADVAGEFQDVCEEYAEAIFTSEFLKPLQSSSLSVS